MYAIQRKACALITHTTILMERSSYNIVDKNIKEVYSVVSDRENFICDPYLGPQADDIQAKPESETRRWVSKCKFCRERSKQILTKSQYYVNIKCKPLGILIAKAQQVLCLQHCAKHPSDYVISWLEAKNVHVSSFCAMSCFIPEVVGRRDWSELPERCWMCVPRTTGQKQESTVVDVEMRNRQPLKRQYEGIQHEKYVDDDGRQNWKAVEN